ncbi:MAG: FG-GAP repeat domain-containing protein, partial [Acidobacteriota bacterium]
MRWLALLALATGCIDDHYECRADSDCNVGVAGRCELDHHCTSYDPTCPLERRYTAHSGSASGACFDDAIAPRDPCASGQPPAPIADACAASVCARLPSCCETAWGEACVQLAEVACGATCDTRIALTASASLVPGAATTVELFDLRLGAGAPSYVRLDAAASPRKGFLDWLAPARGTSEPRLASLDAGRSNLVIDGAPAMPIGADRSYDGLYSTDFDRDGRDKAVLASYQIPDDTALDVLDLETGRERELTTPNAMPLATPGDWDGDPFPDVVAATGGGQAYALYRNGDDPAGHARELDPTWSSGATAATAGNVPLQAFAWADVDGDGVVDLVELGAELRVHFGNDDRQPDTPRVQIDCDPLLVNPNSTCNGGTDV